MTLSSGTPSSDARVYKTLAVLVGMAFLLLGGRLWQLQVMQGDSYYRRAEDNFIKQVDLPAARGQIRDRKGRVLVDNRPSYDIYVTPALVTPTLLERLRKHLKLTDEQVASLAQRVKETAQRRGLDRYQQVLAVEDIDRDQVALVESDADDLPGVSVQAAAHRLYPFGALAAHVLGYMNQITAEELSSQHELGYHAGDYVGRAGLERQWEQYLRGKDGWERFVVDARRRVKNNLDEKDLEALIGGDRRKEPEPGDNIVLTLDADLQKIVERALSRHHSAAAVVVDVHSGRVLALASWPAYDPNELTGRLTRAEAERLGTDPMRPLLDKALAENYFPGSTFKIIPALAGLSDKIIGPYDKIPCHGAYEKPGHTFHCMEVHGPTNLYKAIAESCDVYFYQLGEKVGLDRIADMAQAFGFGSPTGIGFPGEVAGLVPTTEWYKKNGGFRIGYTLNTAIGQGSTKVTVLQEALAYAAIANGGDLYMPQLVARIETPSGQTVQRFEPRLRRHIQVDPENLEAVRRGLCGVVSDPHGTMHAAWDPSVPVEVCGKTGTAQVRKLRRGEGEGWDTANDHAWFAGFAPARDPQIAFAVLVEHGGFGAHAAGPAALEIVKGYFTKIAPVAKQTRGKGETFTEAAPR